MATTIDGLVTGLDTTKIIDGLLSVQAQRVALLRAKEVKIVQQQSAFKNVEARLLSLQSNLSRLGRAQNSVFDGKLVASSSEQALTAAASSSAIPGVYALRVDSLARAHQIASQGYDDRNSTISQGSFQIRVGAGPTTTISVDSTNNTLSGLASAINNSGAGVTATIIHDGTDSRTQPYRLLLTATATGARNAITITNSLAADGGAARRPEFAAKYIGGAVPSSTFTGTSTLTSNAGAGGYTGTANKTYNFTVLTDGTVGTTDGIQIQFADSTGDHTGTVTVNAADLDTFKTVAEGIQLKLGAGTLVAGETFSIDAFVPNVQEAANASVTLGSGNGALTTQSESNRVDGLIGGVTLNLLSADPTKTVQLTVSNDTKSASKAIVEFVDTYNEFLEYIDAQVRYDAQSGKAGVLLGNRTVTAIQDQVRRSVGELVGGVNGQMNRLTALGISTNSAGHLEVNQAKLDTALAGGLSGVSYNDVRRLFALSGESTNGGVQFVVGGVRTQASVTPYQVDVSQAAERATIAATNTLDVSTVISTANNSLNVTIDGRKSGPITLAAGTYTRLGLVQELEAQINANADLSGRRVTVSLAPAGDRLVISSQAFGSTSEVAIGTGTALTALGLSGSETDKGQDVVGRFIVDGVTEEAVGSGQFLVGSSTNAHTADLQVRVTLGSSQIVDGAEASLKVTRGIASRLDVVLGGLLDPVTGRLKSVNDGFQASIDDLEKSVKQQNAFTELRRQALVKQFAVLEGNISRLKNTGDFLAAQLSSNSRSN